MGFARREEPCRRFDRSEYCQPRAQGRDVRTAAPQRSRIEGHGIRAWPHQACRLLRSGPLRRVTRAVSGRRNVRDRSMTSKVVTLKVLDGIFVVFALTL